MDFLFSMNLQIMWLVNTFRARVVDISEHALTIEVHLLMICALFYSIIVYGFWTSVFILLLIIGRQIFFLLVYHLIYAAFFFLNL